jgi:hypothetical protein
MTAWLTANWHWVVTACAVVLFVVSSVLCIAMDELDGKRSRYISPARKMPWQKAEGSDDNG